MRFIEENLEPLFELVQGRVGAPRFADAVVACLERKHTLEQDAGRFVVDRCPLDLMNFWIVSRLPRRCEGHDIFELCGRHTGGYDFVVLTPWGGIPLGRESPDDAGKRRIIDPWIQFKGSAMIAGLAHHFVAPARIIQIPRQPADAEARLEFVLAAIRGGAAGAGRGRPASSAREG